MAAVHKPSLVHSFPETAVKEFRSRLTYRRYAPIGLEAFGSHQLANVLSSGDKPSATVLAEHT